VFSVGVVLHELLTGKRLFAAATEEEEMRKILTARIPKPTELAKELPEAVSDVVMRALARERADRFASAKDLAKALETACGKLLFDRERVGSFMRELFEEKVAATREMLESVDGNDPAVLQRALAALRQDDGMVFEGASSAQVVSKRAAKTDRYEAPVPVAAPVAARPVAGPTRVQSPARRSTWVFILAAVVFAGLLGFAGMRLLDLGQSEKALPRGFDPTGGMKPLPGALNAAPAPTPTPTPPAPTTPEPAHEEKHHRSPQGGLTLVTLPDADVYFGSKKLGRTPLFNQPLPAGVHRLKLRGPDGKSRYLSVPIVAGKTAALKLSLSDLPTR
jgi:serine/threonine-protein kinase